MLRFFLGIILLLTFSNASADLEGYQSTDDNQNVELTPATVPPSRGLTIQIPPDDSYENLNSADRDNRCCLTRFYCRGENPDGEIYPHDCCDYLTNPAFCRPRTRLLFTGAIGFVVAAYIVLFQQFILSAHSN